MSLDFYRRSESGWPVGRGPAVGSGLNDPIDTACRATYGRYPDTYVKAIIAGQARATTLRPRPL
jgi:hypothetical protein